MKIDRLSTYLATLEHIQERYLNEKHPVWADAAFENARDILYNVYYYNADRYEMLVYIWRIINEVYDAERWNSTLPTKEEDDK